MKLVKRLVSAILLVSMLMALAGCGNNGDVGGLNAGQIDLLPKIELENKTVKFYTHLKAEDFENGDLPTALDIFKDVYGGEVEFIPIVNWEEYMSKLYGMYMSDDMPDLIQGGYSEFAIFTSKDMLQPVDDYLDFSEPIWDGVRDSLEAFKFQDKHYVIPYDQGYAAMLYFNPKIFEENGLETPLDYYNRGEWTWDTMLDLAKKLTMDTDGDGNNDVFGIEPIAPYWTLADTTGQTLMTIENDEPVWHYNDSKIADAANLVRSMGTAGANVIGGNFRDGTAAMCWPETNSDGPFLGWRGMYSDIWANGTVDFCPLPRYPQADEHYFSTRMNPGLLASKAPNPEGAAAFMLCMRYVQTDEFLQQYDPDGNWKQTYKDWGWSDDQIQRMFYDYKEIKTLPMMFRAWNNGNTWQIGFDDLNTKTWSQIVQEIAPAHEAESKRLIEEIKKVQSGSAPVLETETAE